MIKLRSTVATLAAMTLVASLSAAVVATSEPEEPPMSVDVIEGVTWVLSSQAIDGDLVAVPDRALISLLMDGGQAGGQGGCNGYFTSYRLDGSALSFGDIGSTMMACLPPLMDSRTGLLRQSRQRRFLPADGRPHGTPRRKRNDHPRVRSGTRDDHRGLLGGHGHQQPAGAGGCRIVGDDFAGHGRVQLRWRPHRLRRLQRLLHGLCGRWRQHLDRRDASVPP